MAGASTLQTPYKDNSMHSFPPTPTIFLFSTISHFLFMASSLHIISLSLLIFISLSQSQPTFRPKALLLPVSKHPSTLQYITRISLGTPLVPTSLVVDLGSRYLWIDCETDYKSSTYRPGRCRSAPCSAAKADGCNQCYSSPRPGCHNNTCTLFPHNTVTGFVDVGNVALDTISLRSTDGTKSGPVAKVPSFIFACSPDDLISGLANGVKGMAGLGRSQVGLPTQLSSAFGGSLPRKFALCLPSTSKGNGVIFFGHSPYIFYPFYNISKLIDVSKRFTYTPLIINPVSTAGASIKGEASSEYFIGVKSITINKNPIQINSSLLSFTKRGFGGTKISTVKPYSVLQTSIYKALAEAFVKELAAENVSRVESVAPFTECFSTKNMGFTTLGPGVPDIALVFGSKSEEWVIYGGNSMVEVSRDVVCLGFVDGGFEPRTSIVIGAHQLEDNLLQFDLAASRLALTSTLLFEEIGCTNFNF